MGCCNVVICCVLLLTKRCFVVCCYVLCFAFLCSVFLLNMGPSPPLQNGKHVRNSGASSLEP